MLTKREKKNIGKEREDETGTNYNTKDFFTKYVHFILGTGKTLADHAKPHSSGK